MRELPHIRQLRQRPEVFQAPACIVLGGVSFFTSAPRFSLPSCAFCSHSRKSSCRNLHWRPTLIAGSSLHSAQRHTARVEIPSHRATAAVVRSISEFVSNLSMDFASVLLFVRCFEGRVFPPHGFHREGARYCSPLIGAGQDDASFSVEDVPASCQEFSSMRARI